MKIKELIDRIQELYSKGVKSDDSRLSNRHIYSKMVSARSRVVEQDSKKKQQVNQYVYQTIPCAELIAVPAHECPCLPPIGCKILRTKYPLPQPLSNYDTHLIQSVTSLDGNVVYSEESWIGAGYKKGNKYTSNKLDYYLKNGYLYVTHKSGPRVITITGLFNDPVEVGQYPSFCDEYECDDCTSPLDMDFAIDGTMSEVVESIVINTLLAPFTNAQEDITSNTRDSREDQAK